MRLLAAHCVSVRNVGTDLVRHVCLLSSRELDEQVERELMILGFISFVLFLTETTGGALQLGESWLFPFEFAHFLIFFVAIFYTLQAFWLAVMVGC